MILAAQALPLFHAVQIVRPLMTGAPVDQWFVHVAVILLYWLFATYWAVVLLRRRMLV